MHVNDLTTITDYATTRMYADRLNLCVLKTQHMLVEPKQRIRTLTQGLDLSINGISLKK